MLAQGALEKPLVFDGNDRPGVMLAGAAQTYLNRYGVKVGDRPAIVTAHDSAWHAAFDLAEAGAKPAAIVDVRPTVDPALTDRARALGIETLLGRTVTGTSGRLRVKSLRVNRMDERQGRRRARHRLRRGADVRRLDPLPAPLQPHARAGSPGTRRCRPSCPARRPRRCRSPAPAAASGAIAKPRSTTAPPPARRPPATPAARPTPQAHAVTADRTGSGVTLKELPTDRNPATAKAFIDFQNDVTAKDIRLAVREGMRSIEHVKRYTTNGMATDQGKMSNVNGLMIAADALGKAPPQVGLTTFRPPYTPTTFGTFAGYHQDATFEVTRKTPIDPWAEANGAVFEPVALWRRAWYFPKPGRGHARRRRPRVPRHPRLARHLRRLDPRQDRGRRARTPSPSWSGCTPTPGRSSASAAAATACSSARTASSATTASSAASPPTASTSPPPPAAPRASST